MSKISILIIAILLAGFLMIVPPRLGKAQHDTTPKLKAETTKATPAKLDQSIKSLDKKHDQLAENIQLIKQATKPKPKMKLRKITAIKEVPAVENHVAVRLNGQIYEVEPELYKGYMIIDIDSLKDIMEIAEVEEIETNPNILIRDIPDTVVKHVDTRIKLLQKIKNFFKSKNNK